MRIRIFALAFMFLGLVLAGFSFGAIAAEKGGETHMGTASAGKMEGASSICERLTGPTKIYSLGYVTARDTTKFAYKRVKAHIEGDNGFRTFEKKCEKLCGDGWELYAARSAPRTNMETFFYRKTK